MGVERDKRDECGCHPECTVLNHECAVPCRWPVCLTSLEQEELLNEFTWPEYDEE